VRQCFRKAWKRDICPAPPPANGVAGKWEGTWLSAANGHHGKLRCVVSDAEGVPMVSYAPGELGRLSSSTTATWKSASSVAATRPTQQVVQEKGRLLHLQRRPPDADWAGGKYHYEGTVKGDDFNACYESAMDRGTLHDETCSLSNHPARRGVHATVTSPMKWFSSFRAKLIFTVFPVVAGITIATLVLAEWKFTAAYRRLFAEQFESQISTFSAAKKKRTEALSEQLARLAQQPEIVAAITKQDFAAAGQILRPQLEALATDRLQSEFPAAGGRGGIKERDRADAGRAMARLMPAQMPYIAIIDPEGNFVAAPKKNAVPGRNLMPPLPKESATSAEFRRKSGRMQWLGERKLEDILKEQESRLLARRVRRGQPHGAGARGLHHPAA
jgi:hypothetical protein